MDLSKHLIISPPISGFWAATAFGSSGCVWCSHAFGHIVSGIWGCGPFSVWCRVVLTRALFCAHHEKTRGAKQCITGAPTAISMEVHHGHVLRGGATDCRTVISISKIPSPAPNHRKNLIVTNHQKQEPPNSMVSKIVSCSDQGVVLVRAGWGVRGSRPPGYNLGLHAFAYANTTLRHLGGGGYRARAVHTPEVVARGTPRSYPILFTGISRLPLIQFHSCRVASHRSTPLVIAPPMS